MTQLMPHKMTVGLGYLGMGLASSVGASSPSSGMLQVLRSAPSIDIWASRPVCLRRAAAMSGAVREKGLWTTLMDFSATSTTNVST
jgi:hypothetical protein